MSVNSLVSVAVPKYFLPAATAALFRPEPEGVLVGALPTLEVDVVFGGVELEELGALAPYPENKPQGLESVRKRE